MRRALLLQSVVLLAIAVAIASAQNPVTAPITEWPVLSPASDARERGLAIDKHGAVWTSGVGEFFVPDDGIIAHFFSMALTRLIPRTNSLSYWILGPSEFPAVTGLTAAPDGTIFFARHNTLFRLDPATNILTQWTIPTVATSLRAITDVALDTSSPGELWVWVPQVFSQAREFSSQYFNQVTRLNPATGDAQTFSWFASSSFEGDKELVSHLAVDASGTVWLTVPGGSGPGFGPGYVISLDPGSATIATKQARTFRQISSSEIDHIKLDPNGGMFLNRCFYSGYITRYRPWVLETTTYSEPLDLDPGVLCGMDVASKVYFTKLGPPELNGPGKGKIGRFDPSVATGVSTLHGAPSIQAVTTSTFTIEPSTTLLQQSNMTATRSTTIVTSTASAGFEEFDVPSGDAFPMEIAVTPCNAFFTEVQNGKLGRWKTSAEEPVHGLQNLVEALANDSVLNSGQRQSLSGKLDGALSAFNRNEPATAGKVLTAFINETTALVQGGVLSSSQGNLLISPATAIFVGCMFVD